MRQFDTDLLRVKLISFSEVEAITTKLIAKLKDDGSTGVVKSNIQ